MAQDPLDTALSHAVSPAAMRVHHSLVNQFADVFRDRLGSDTQFSRDLLLPDCRLVLGNLNEYLQPGDFALAPEK